MKVENINHGNLHLIEFNENESDLQTQLKQYHVVQNIYDITEDQLQKYTIKTIYINPDNDCYRFEIPDLSYSFKNNDPKSVTTEIDITKFNLEENCEYEHTQFLHYVIEAEIKPKMPLHYYKKDSKEFIKRYIDMKVPYVFIYKKLLMEIVEAKGEICINPKLASYGIPHTTINPNNQSQLKTNNMIRDIVKSLSDLF